MSASVKADIDYSKLEELRKRLPDLSELDLAAPNMEDVGKRAGETVDRILGRRRRTPWPQIAAVVGLVAVIGLLMAWLTWSRRSTWSGAGSEHAGTQLGSETPLESESLHPGETVRGAEVGWDAETTGGGLTAAEASLTTGQPEDRA
ncbi:MAG: hypothetical protein FIA92_01420 [Chloroflexi bacterium]|nr:hypothetical protein [Chloroflexota bacterium]